MLVVEIDDVYVVLVVFLEVNDSMYFVQIEHELFQLVVRGFDEVEYQSISEDDVELYQHGMSNKNKNRNIKYDPVLRILTVLL